MDYENLAKRLANGAEVNDGAAAIAFAVLHLAEQVARVVEVLENGVVTTKAHR